MNYIDKINSKKDAENLSIRKLSNICDISEHTLKDILSKRCTPRVSTIERICEALCISLAWLFCGENEVVFDSGKKTAEFFLLFDGLSDEAKSHLILLVKCLLGS